MITADVHFAEINKNGRGISSGLGMCSCTDMSTCTCGPRTHSTGSNLSGGPPGGGSSSRNKKENRQDKKRNEAEKGRSENFLDVCGGRNFHGGLKVHNDTFFLNDLINDLTTNRNIGSTTMKFSPCY